MKKIFFFLLKLAKLDRLRDIKYYFWNVTNWQRLKKNFFHRSGMLLAKFIQTYLSHFNFFSKRIKLIFNNNQLLLRFEQFIRILLQNFNSFPFISQRFLQFFNFVFLTFFRGNKISFIDRFFL